MTSNKKQLDYIESSNYVHELLYVAFSESLTSDRIRMFKYSNCPIRMKCIKVLARGDILFIHSRMSRWHVASILREEEAVSDLIGKSAYQSTVSLHYQCLYG